MKYFAHALKKIKISDSYILLKIYQIRHQTSFQQPELNPFKLIKSNINTNCVWSLDFEFLLSSAVQPIYIINNVSSTISHKNYVTLGFEINSSKDIYFLIKLSVIFLWKISNPKGLLISQMITFMFESFRSKLIHVWYHYEEVNSWKSYLTSKVIQDQFRSLFFREGILCIETLFYLFLLFRISIIGSLYNPIIIFFLILGNFWLSSETPVSYLLHFLLKI